MESQQNYAIYYEKVYRMNLKICEISNDNQKAKKVNKLWRK